MEFCNYNPVTYWFITKSASRAGLLRKNPTPASCFCLFPDQTTLQPCIFADAVQRFPANHSISKRYLFVSFSSSSSLFGAHIVRTFHVPTVSICAHGLSFLSVADLPTQSRLLSWYRRPCLTGRRLSLHVFSFGCIGIRLHSCCYFYSQRIDTHLTDPYLRTDRGFPLVFGHCTNEAQFIRPFRRRCRWSLFLFLSEDWWRTSAPLVFKPEFLCFRVKLCYTRSRRSALCSSNSSDPMSEVTVRRARLILRWVTACGQVNHLGM